MLEDMLEETSKTEKQRKKMEKNIQKKKEGGVDNYQNCDICIKELPEVKERKKEIQRNG